jgi:hypothetical protein
MTLTLCGYQLVVSAEAGTVQVTCPDLPRLCVTERTIGRALVRAQEALADILLGRSELGFSWAAQD